MIHVEQARSRGTEDLRSRIDGLLNAFPTWRLINTTFIDKKIEPLVGAYHDLKISQMNEVYYFWMIFEEND